LHCPPHQETSKSLAPTPIPLAHSDSAWCRDGRWSGGDHDYRIATDGKVFLAYLEKVLCPRLKPRQIVVMDNLSAHKHPQVREKIEQCGAQLLYPTPYSPDFNPIEMCWTKIKDYLRAARAPMVDALDGP
jgi:DDE superfamily endonuclease